MARKSRRNYRNESRRTPFELELDTPRDGREYVTFLDPNKLPTKTAFELSRTEDPSEVLKMLLSEEDYDAFWSEWASAPVDETNALLEDVMSHYGADKGKR